MTIRPLLFLMTLLAMPVHAWFLEIGTAGEYGKIRWDKDDYFSFADSKIRHTEGFATFLLKDIDTGAATPLAEAAYLQRTGHLNFRIHRNKNEPDNAETIHNDVVGFSTRIVIEETIIWHIAVEDRKHWQDGGQTNRDRYAAYGIGSYFRDNQNLIVTLHYRKTRESSDVQIRQRQISVDYKNMMTLQPAGHHLFVGGRAILGRSETQWMSGGEGASIGLGAYAHYYPLKNLGIRLALDRPVEIMQYDDVLSTDIQEDTIRGEIGVDYFPLDSIRLTASVYGGLRNIQLENDNDEEDTSATLTGVNLGLAFRF